MLVRHRSPARLLLTLGLLLLVGCRERQDGPPRPAQVPKEAFWLGGPDGGVFVLLQKSPGPRYEGRIFYPHGEPWYDGPLTVEPGDRPDVDIGDSKIFVGWDGERLLLSDGRALRATGRHP